MALKVARGVVVIDERILLLLQWNSMRLNALCFASSPRFGLLPLSVCAHERLEEGFHERVVSRYEGPGRFAGKNSETSEWAKATRDGIAAAKAIMSAAADPAEEALGFRGLEEQEALGVFRPKRESSESFIALRGCFDTSSGWENFVSSLMDYFCC